VNEAVICEKFVFEVAVVLSRPATRWMALSIGTETSVLTTSGLAPG
jgi:hypothetical protein